MKKFAGLIVFFIIIGAVVVWQWFSDDSITHKKTNNKHITVKTFIGGEKKAFLHNPEVIKILKDKYNVTVDETKAGSIDMVTDLDYKDKDALWPSNRIAVEIFKQNGGHYLSSENVFNSPIVLYAYDIVAEALIKQKIVELKNNSYYIVDFKKLIEIITDKKPWKSIGLSELYGNVAVFSTNPTRSNSGNMFAGLLANMLNDGSVADESNLIKILPRLKAYFRDRGYMETSSGDIFKNFITTGVGSKPIIVGYENQLVEFSIENEKYIDYLKKRIRTFYPVPTVWTSHPVIALTANGKRFTEALKDEDIQKIAWETHGFRSGLIGVQNDPEVLKVTGIPKEITAVIPMPNAKVMSRIIDELK